MEIQPSQYQNNLNHPPAPLEPGAPDKKRGFKFGFSMAIVIICLVAAGVAVYWINTEPVEQLDSNINVTKPTNETAGWHTYQDKVFGFEIRYPSNWENRYEAFGDNTITIAMPGYEPLANPEEGLSISSEATTGKDLVNLQNSLREGEKSEEKIILDNVEFTKFIFGGSPSQFILFTIQDGRYYEISSAENRQIDQILATFKFIEVDTAGLHVYENKDLGFSFSYPAEFGEVVYSEGQGETGKIFGALFSHNKNLFFGGISPDYSAPRGGGFTGTYGYLKKGGKYYKNSTELIEQSLVKEIQAENTTGILILGKNYDGPSDMPYQFQLGALFNLPNKTFPGIGFIDTHTDKLSQSDFEKILSTFKLIK